MAREGPLGERMDRPAPGLQGRERGPSIPIARPLVDVKLFGSPLVFPLLVFLVFVFIGESSITYGVLKRRNPLG